MPKAKKTTEHKKKVFREWQKQHTKIVNFRFFYTTDKDILEKLSSVENKSAYIKKLIREDIARN